MNYLLDTCVISDFLKKIPNVIAHFQKISTTELCISTITVMEIEYGLKLNVERELKIRPLWEKLLEHIAVLPFVHEDSIFSAQVRAKLKVQGLPIGPYDILLAGSALANDLIFVTPNTAEFEHLAEIKLEDWRK